MIMERARSTPTDDRGRRRPWAAMAIVLALAFLFPSLPAARAIPASQQETAISGQVIAQGVTRLPRGEIAWALSRLDLAADELAVEAFPVGFVLADGATVALLAEDGEALNLLQAGEAAFLPAGRPGALTSATDPATNAYQIAILPAADAAAGGVIAGNPFPTPEGQRFDLELSRYQLAAGEETTIPASRSGAPVLLLQTDGVSQLQAAAEQVVTLDPGEYAQLPGETVVAGASDAPATFVVVAIGEPTTARGERTRARAGQDESAASGRERRERRARRARAGGRGGGQIAPQPTGSGTVPITGAPTATVAVGAPAATPGTEPTAGTPAPTVEVPQQDGTPAPAATVPATPEATATATLPATENLTETPTTTPVAETPAATAPPVESPTPTVPVIETPTTEPPPEEPAGETPVIETPVIETPAIETPIIETPMTEAPAAESIAPDAAVEEPIVAEPAAPEVVPDVEGPVEVAPPAVETPIGEAAETG